MLLGWGAVHTCGAETAKCGPIISPTFSSPFLRAVQGIGFFIVLFYFHHFAILQCKNTDFPSSGQKRECCWTGQQSTVMLLKFQNMGYLNLSSIAFTRLTPLPYSPHIPIVSMCGYLPLSFLDYVILSISYFPLFYHLSPPLYLHSDPSMFSLSLYYCIFSLKLADANSTFERSAMGESVPGVVSTQ